MIYPAAARAQPPAPDPIVFVVGNYELPKPAPLYTVVLPPAPPPPPPKKGQRQPQSGKVTGALVETIIAATPKTDYADGDYGGQCVTFAKKFLGRGGTWGYGGRNLSANATAEDADVVIFYNHVAVKIGLFADGTLVLAESNNDWSERVEIGRQIKVGDPSIWKYHKF